MKDSKKKSISEVLTNMGISLPIHYFANFLVLPPYAADIGSSDVWVMAGAFGHLAVWFTIISFARQFALRRLYNLAGPNETGYSILMRVFRRIR